MRRRFRVPRRNRGRGIDLVVQSVDVSDLEAAASVLVASLDSRAEISLAIVKIAGIGRIDDAAARSLHTMAARILAGLPPTRPDDDPKDKEEGAQSPRYSSIPLARRDSSLLPGTLHHFTSHENLKSIRQHGLLSIQQLERDGLHFLPSSSEGSRRTDRSRGLDGFIHLCLDKEHPMAWAAFYQRELSIAWIEVDSSIVDQRRTLYSSSNALRSGIRPDGDPQTAVAGDKQAEVLVFGDIPLQYLTIR